MDRPLLIATTAVWLYWVSVAVLAVHRRVARGRSSGIVPKDALERGLWIPWVPVIAAWIALPALALRKEEAPWAVPAFASSGLILAVRWGAALAVAACYGLTTLCWRQLGKSWSVAVVPDEPTNLVTSGPYGLVRHPIYAVSIAMMLCTLLVLPSWPMAVAAAAHLGLMHVKARHEETHLARAHGVSYEDYCRRVGRFVPRPK